MLRELVELAEREVKFPAGYGEKRAQGLIALTIDAHGRFLTLDVLPSILVPFAPFLNSEQSTRTSTPRAQFLVDNAGYALGLGAVKSSRTTTEQVALFVAELVQAQIESPAIQAVLAFYREPLFTENLRAIQGLRETWDKVTVSFRFQGVMVQETPEVMRYVADADARRQGTKGAFQDVITGRHYVGAPLRIHPGLGGIFAGIKYINFAKKATAFSSWGRQEGANAPTSAETARKFGQATTWLFERINKRFRQVIAFSDRVYVPYWTTAPSTMLTPAQIDPDFFGVGSGRAKSEPEEPEDEEGEEGETAEANEAEEEEEEETDEVVGEASPQTEDVFAEDIPVTVDMVRSVLTSAFNGRVPPDFDTEQFLAIRLKVGTGRITFQSSVRSTVGDLKRRLIQYHADLAIGEAVAGRIIVRHWNIDQLLNSNGVGFLSKRERNRLRPELFFSSLLGAPLPRELVDAALNTFFAPPPGLRSRQWEWRLPIVAAIIKAHLCQLGRRCGDPNLEGITVMLDEQRTDTGYILGRIQFCVAILQDQAYGELVNKTIDSRLMGSIRTRPQEALDLMTRYLQIYLKEAQNNGGRFGRLARHAYNIASKIIGLVQEVPAVWPDFNGPSQAAIGYHHQRVAFYLKKPKPPGDTTAAVESDEDADDAEDDNTALATDIDDLPLP